MPDMGTYVLVASSGKEIREMKSVRQQKRRMPGEGGVVEKQSLYKAEC